MTIKINFGHLKYLPHLLPNPNTNPHRLPLSLLAPSRFVPHAALPTDHAAGVPSLVAHLWEPSLDAHQHLRVAAIGCAGPAHAAAIAIFFSNFGVAPSDPVRTLTLQVYPTRPILAAPALAQPPAAAARAAAVSPATTAGPSFLPKLLSPEVVGSERMETATDGAQNPQVISVAKSSVRQIASLYS